MAWGKGFRVYAIGFKDYGVLVFQFLTSTLDSQSKHHHIWHLKSF